MTLFAFRGAKSHEWTICDPTKVDRSMQFCDLKCVYASAPKDEMDGARSCMTFTAIWCERFDRHVMKSQPCSERKERRFGLKTRTQDAE